MRRGYRRRDSAVLLLTFLLLPHAKNRLIRLPRMSRFFMHYFLPKTSMTPSGSVPRRSFFPEPEPPSSEPGMSESPEDSLLSRLTAVFFVPVSAARHSSRSFFVYLPHCSTEAKRFPAKGCVPVSRAGGPEWG